MLARSACGEVNVQQFKIVRSTSRNGRQGNGRLQEYVQCSESLVHARPRLTGVLETLHTVTGSDAAPVSFSRHRDFLVQPKIHESSSKLRYGILGPPC